MDQNFFAVLSNITPFDAVVIVLALIGWWHLVRWLWGQMVRTAVECNRADEILDDVEPQRRGYPIIPQPWPERRGQRLPRRATDANIFYGYDGPGQVPPKGPPNRSICDPYEQTDATSRYTDISSEVTR